MTALQKINKKTLSVMVDGQSISLPEYVKRAVCTYFFDTDSFFLAKRCHICKQLNEVEQLIEGNWQDIHDVTKYRKLSSGYSSYCVQCINEKKSRRSQR